jgi:transglutaminase-like putative cysteine protease/Tfp pilus assembly protein PilF
MRNTGDAFWAWVDCLSQGLAFSLLCGLAFIPIKALVNLSLLPLHICIAALAGMGLHRARARVGTAAAASLLLPWLYAIFIGIGLGLFACVSGKPKLSSPFLELSRSFLPLYPGMAWAAFCSYRTRASARLPWPEFAVDGALIVVIFLTETFNARVRFSSLRDAALWAALIAFLLLCRLAIRLSPGFARRSLRFLGVYLPAAILVFLLIFAGFSQRALSAGGGLLKPTLSRFDFSNYLGLESQISLSKELVLFVRKDSQDENIFLRRFILSGYKPRQGFFAEKSPYVEDIPERRPELAREYAAPPGTNRARLAQDYYLVNIDAGAFIAMNGPISSAPLRSWAHSSFRAAYHVESEVPSELSRQAAFAVTKGTGLSAGALEYYTRYGNDREIKALAENLTRNVPAYAGKVKVILDYLKYGYRYSLKPGVAADGNQLHHFLFKSKKGYCSYFAFSMTLMLRSIGIPARVAAGFYIDPQTQVFSLYPVRADMAHAWVEVYFPGCGWMEFDPTSSIPAAGEDLGFDSGFDVREYRALAQEILQNSGAADEFAHAKIAAPNAFRSALARLWSALRGQGARLILGLLLLLVVLNATLPRLYCRLSRDRRKRAIRSFRLMLRERRLAGWPAAGSREGALGTCERLDAYCSPDQAHLRCHGLFARALYAPAFGKEDEDDLARSLVRSRKDFAAKAGGTRALLARFGLPVPGPRLKAFAAIFFVLCLGPRLSAQDATGRHSAQAAIQEASFALLTDNYDEALRILNQAAAEFPKEKAVFVKIADIYRDKEFYSLALDPLKRAEQLDPKDGSILYSLADTLSCLGRDAESAEYLRRTLAIEPDNTDVISDLGWIYFKLHQVDRGVELMESAVRRLGTSVSFEITLGTLYSEKYDYVNSRKNYEAAINTALAEGNDDYAGVACYNLSILESKFHHFDEALRYTRLSVQYYDRASAHLALGELALRRMDIDGARAEYELANETDKSPLSAIALADAALASGSLDEAVAICEKSLKRTDYAWMANFGTDLESHQADIYHVLYQA